MRCYPGKMIIASNQESKYMVIEPYLAYKLNKKALFLQISAATKTLANSTTNWKPFVTLIFKPSIILFCKIKSYMIYILNLVTFPLPFEIRK
jgi:hypothetical protein